jgi:hypothetical protein
VSETPALSPLAAVTWKKLVLKDDRKADVLKALQLI